MFAKLLVLCCACAAAVAAPGIYDGLGLGLGIGPGAIGHIAGPAYASPLIAKQVIPGAHVLRAEPVDPNPAYTFSYGVADPTTGDQKTAAETLQNGVVQGSYSLVEPDGHVRRVTYTADNVNGFNAVVERTGAAGHAGPIAVSPLAKLVSPAQVAVASPLARYGLPAVASPWG